MKRFFLRLTFLIGSIYTGVLVSQSPQNFSSAKKHSLELFKDHPITLYCNCRFDRYKRIDLKSCHMQEASHLKRAHRVEFEHMMPAENFGRHFQCWREKLCKDVKGRAYKGRKCCKKINPEFNQVESELYNLWPSVGLINQLRSNFRYSIIEGNHNTYGCNFIADSKTRKAEPADFAKGIVARANLFMSDKYHIRLSKSQRKLFESWHQQFPPCSWELSWAKAVAAIEGYENPYITKKD